MRQRSLIEEYLKGIRRLERAVKRINQIKTPEAIIKNVLKECNNILKSSSCALVLKREKNLWDTFIYRRGEKTLKKGDSQCTCSKYCSCHGEGKPI